MALLDALKDFGADAFRQAKDAYVQVQVAKAQAPYQAAVSAQQNLLTAENAAPENAKVLTPAQLTKASDQAAASYRGGVQGFWAGLEGWQKGVLGVGLAGLAFMGLRAATKG